MSTIPATAKCDGCGKNRIEDGNHWVTFKVVYENEIQILKGIYTTHTVDRHACGVECATKLFNRWFLKGSL